MVQCETTEPGTQILVFIPTYNCERQIGRVIAQFTPDIAALFDCIAVIDNRSADRTVEVAATVLRRQLPAHRTWLVRNRENNGLGGSHKVAFELALQHGFTHLVVLHGDDQGSIADLVPYIRSGEFRRWDCLLGGRFMPGSRLQNYSATRTALNRLCNLGFSVVTGRRIHDMGAGLNCYRVAAFADRRHMRFINTLSFNQVLLLHSIAAGHRIRFFPLTWREADQVSNVRLASMGVQLGRNVLSYVFARRRLLEQDRAGWANHDYSSEWIAGEALRAEPAHATA